MFLGLKEYRMVFWTSDFMAPYLFIASDSWFGAREIARSLYHDEALEGNWRALKRVESSEESLLKEAPVSGVTIVYRNLNGKVKTKIVTSSKIKSEKKPIAKKRRKP
jgi:hypothetical protein